MPVAKLIVTIGDGSAVPPTQFVKQLEDDLALRKKYQAKVPNPEFGKEGEPEEIDNPVSKRQFAANCFVQYARDEMAGAERQREADASTGKAKARNDALRDAVLPHVTAEIVIE